MGDCVYQKTYRDEAYRQRKNQGELDMFIQENDHEAIVSREVFEGANRMLKRHARECGEEREENAAAFRGSSSAACARAP